MKYLTLDFFNEFECIGSECPNTCCAGWSVLVDDKSAEYYKSVEGEFGDKLRENIQTVEKAYYIRGAQKRCPFLDENELCEIYKELGKEKMCKTCTNYPRESRMYGDIWFSTLTITCPEVARMLFARTDSIQVDFGEDGKNDLEIEEGGDWEFFNLCIKGLTTSVSILQNRSFSLKCRIRLLLLFNHTLQKYIEDNVDTQELIKMFSVNEALEELAKGTEVITTNYDIKLEAFLKLVSEMNRLREYLPLTSLVEDYNEFIQMLKTNYDSDLINELYQKIDTPEIELQYENYAVYHIFVYYMNAYKERQFSKEVDRFAFLLNFYQHMLMACLYKRGTECSIVLLQAEIFSTLARGMEHSTQFRKEFYKICEELNISTELLI